MAVLFAATELESFQRSSATAVTQSTTAGRFDSNFSRGAIEVADGSHYAQADFTAETDGWLHFLAYFTDLNNIEHDNQIFQLRDSSTGQVVLQLDGDNGAWDMEYWNGSSFTEVSIAGGASGGGFPIGELVRFDVQWTIHNSTGVFRIYMNESLIVEFTGDTLQTGFTTIDQLRLSSGSTRVSADQTYFSEVIVADEDTRGWRLATLGVTADGTNTAWTGDYTDIDEIDLDDADDITSDTADQVHGFAVDNVPAEAAGYSVEAVVVGMRANRAASGPQNLQAHVRSGGTDYFSSNVGTLGLGLLPFQAVFATDPGTASAWAQSGVNAAEVGVKSIT